MSGRVFGSRRTLHGKLVAVPLVGYPGALLGYVVHAGAPERFWLDFAIAMNCVGVLGAFAAALAGTAGLRKRVPDAGPARNVAVGHALLNVFAFVLFTVNLGVYAGRWGDGAGAGASAGVTLSALGLAAAFGAFGMGRSLVTDHNVAAGVDRGLDGGVDGVLDGSR
ncbi:DUF2231 domain-containing protein [Yinghuangia sp. YIM S09857]|uniref:DUF2231 domain-containing protein n=1 Tax=Yinghuangia sp. YIM S09857 TaxID=3436929 RepID=UPI003F52B11A